jgi:DNA-binding protein H-NS
MGDLDLNALSLADVKQLHKDVAKAIAGYKDNKKSEACAALEAHAKELGFSLAELVGQPIRKVRAAVARKYQHPENPEVTWSGRGRRPLWFIAALAAGKTEGSLSV